MNEHKPKPRNFIENLEEAALHFHRRQLFLSPQESVISLSVEEEQEEKFKYYLDLINLELKDPEDIVINFHIKNLKKIILEIIKSVSVKDLTGEQGKFLQDICEKNIEKIRSNLYENNLKRFLKDIQEMGDEFISLFRSDFAAMSESQRIDSVVKEAARYVDQGWLDSDSLEAIRIVAETLKSSLN